MPKPNIGQGDSGKSHLFGTGKKFWKNSAQFKALGALDELNSFVGLARVKTGEHKEVNSLLKTIQNDLFAIQANLAVEPGYKKLDILPGFTKDKAEFLKKQIQKYEKGLPEIKNFILPGGTETASLLHICRAKARTAERAVVEYTRKEKALVRAEQIKTGQAYINRLSDVFFTLARYANYKGGKQDVLWEK